MSLPRLLNESHPLGSLNVRAEIDGWFDTHLGRGIYALQRVICQQVIDGYFGYHLVQLCPARPLDLCESSSIRHRVMAGPACDSAGNVVCDLHELPFASDSIDVLVIHHGIDFSDQPRGVLREAARVLIPGGKLIVVGFNPVSLWGLARMFRRHTQAVPWSGQFLSPSRLSDWLSVLDFELEGREGAIMGLPATGVRMNALNRWLDIVGNRWWNHLGAVYVMAAEKRVSRLTPVARVRSSGRRPILMPVPVKTGTVSRTHEQRVAGHTDD